MKHQFENLLTKEYYDFLQNNIDKITTQIDNSFENSKDEIKENILIFLTKILTPLPIHYEWTPNNDPFDDSGELYSNGKINLSQTLENFLENEYTGNKTPSFVSGCGWFYDTYEANLSDLTRDLGWSVMHDNIRVFLENQFGKLDEKALEDYNMDYIYDEIYDMSMTNQFFFGSAIAEFVGIDKMTLDEIIKAGKQITEE